MARGASKSDARDKYGRTSEEKKAEYAILLKKMNEAQRREASQPIQAAKAKESESDNKADELYKQIPKRLEKYVDIEDGLKNPVKVDIRYYAQEGDGEDGRGSSANYWESEKEAFRDMVDMKIDRENGRVQKNKSKDADGNVWELKQTTRTTEEKINYDPKEWGERTVYVLSKNGEKVSSWRRYRIAGG